MAHVGCDRVPASRAVREVLSDVVQLFARHPALRQLGQCLRLQTACSASSDHDARPLHDAGRRPRQALAARNSAAGASKPDARARRSSERVAMCACQSKTPVSPSPGPDDRSARCSAPSSGDALGRPSSSRRRRAGSCPASERSRPAAASTNESRRRHHAGPAPRSNERSRECCSARSHHPSATGSMHRHVLRYCSANVESVRRARATCCRRPEAVTRCERAHARTEAAHPSAPFASPQFVFASDAAALPHARANSGPF